MAMFNAIDNDRMKEFIESDLFMSQKNNDFIEQGANIHVNDDSALRWISEGHLDVVKYLIEKGANVHVYNDKIIHTTKRVGHNHVAEYLSTV